MARRTLRAWLGIAAVALVVVALPVVASAQPATLVTAVPADPSRAVAYSRGAELLSLLGDAWRVGVLVALLATGATTRMRDLAARATRRSWLVAALYFAMFLAAWSLALAPLGVWDHLREARYGFATESLGHWLRDRAVALAVAAAVGAPVVAAGYAVVRRFPRRAWLLAGAGASLLAVLAMAVAPVYLAPLFNDYRPLAEGPLRTRLLALARRHGVAARDVYVVDASRQSRHGNAYVAGLFGTERVVLYDTLLAAQTPREVEAVLAHELGHYVLGHVWRSLALVVAVLFATAWAAQRAVARWGPRWGVRGLADPAGLPLVLLAAELVGAAVTLPVNAYARAHEREADAFALEATRDPDAFASALRRFTVTDLAEYDPPTVVVWWFHGHPSLRERVEACARWRRAHGDAAPPRAPR